MSADAKMRRMMTMLHRKEALEKRSEIMKSGRRVVQGRVMMFLKAAQMNEIRRPT